MGKRFGPEPGFVSLPCKRGAWAPFEEPSCMVAYSASGALLKFGRRWLVVYERYRYWLMLSRTMTRRHLSTYCGRSSPSPSSSRLARRKVRGKTPQRKKKVPRRRPVARTRKSQARCAMDVFHQAMASCITRYRFLHRDSGGSAFDAGQRELP